MSDQPHTTRGQQTRPAAAGFPRTAVPLPISEDRLRELVVQWHVLAGPRWSAAYDPDSGRW